MKNHILIVGGTGMLKEASLYYANQNFNVSVIARAKSNKLKNLAQHPNIIPVEVDYSNGILLQKQLQETIDQHGPLQTVISWIHGYAQSAHQVIGEMIYSSPCHYFHLLGSGNLEALQKSMNINPLQNFSNIHYHRIVLGHLSNRWLTHQEISQGVIHAVEEKEDTYIIGSID